MKAIKTSLVLPILSLSEKILVIWADWFQHQRTFRIECSLVGEACSSSSLEVLLLVVAQVQRRGGPTTVVFTLRLRNLPEPKIYRNSYCTPAADPGVSGSSASGGLGAVLPVGVKGRSWRLNVYWVLKKRFHEYQL